MTIVENATLPSGIWDIDPVHSEVSFAARYMMVGNVRGRFTSFSGEIIAAPDFLDTSVTVSIDLASVSSGNDQRDERIRSADFLDVASHPVMSYRSTCIHDLGANFIIEGWLTLHGVVRFVPLELEIVGFVTDANGDTRAGFEAAATITRSDFGIDIDVIRPLDGCRVVISDQIEIQIEILGVLRAR